MKKLYVVLLSFTLIISGCSTSNEMDKNSGKEKFVVGMECNYAPFNYQVEKQSATSVAIGGAGYCDGYDIMVARELATMLDRDLSIKKVSWDGLQPALESGEIDAIIAGMTADKDRENGIDFTTNYYSSQMVMITRNDSETANFTDIKQFKGYKVMGQKNTNYDTVISQIKGVKHATPRASYPEVIMALQSKEVDAITAELPVANVVLNQNPDLKIIGFEEGKGFDIDPSVSIGMKKGSQGNATFKKINAYLKKLTVEKQQQMMGSAAASAPQMK